MSSHRRTRPSLLGLPLLIVAVLSIGGAPAASPAAASAHRPTPVAPIPASAFLQPDDLGGAATWSPEASRWPYLRGPRPNGDGGYASARSLRAEGTVAALYAVADRPTVVVEYVAAYQGDGAARYLAELRRALRRVGDAADRPGRWSVQATGVAGHDSLLLRLRRQIEDPVGQPLAHTTYVVVARTGRAVVSLADTGWESGSGHRGVVLDLIGAALGRAAFPTRYRAIPVGGPTAMAHGLNDRGEVVGQFVAGDGVTRAFRWYRGHRTVLPTLPGPGRSATATDINARGEVVGASDGPHGRRAVLWRHGDVTDLGTLGGDYSWAAALNDRGDVVGASTTAAGELHAFLWSGGRMRDLGLPGTSYAADVNNHVTVVGMADFGDPGRDTAFRWRHGVAVRLPAPGRAHVAALNDRGTAVGSYTLDGPPAHAVRWYGGVMTPLGGLPGGGGSGARSVNRRGAILGAVGVAPYSMVEHPVIWASGLTHDLSALGVPAEAAYYVSALNAGGAFVAAGAMYVPAGYLGRRPAT
jgi:probable HAF family extracellular repeat protein